MKDVGFRLRVQRDLREQFLEVCRAQDRPAAQVLREFMRQYIATHGEVIENKTPTSNEFSGGKKSEGLYKKNGG